MHYLGNASIQNYHCVYDIENVVGAAVIAVAASTVALATFFVWRSVWASSWWKRLLSAVILASAVSGMHWVAAIGTRYRLEKTYNKGPSRDATVIVVICLSVSACLVIAGSAALRTRAVRKSAMQAQKITLGAAVFDRHGRILVDTDGVAPSAVITDSFHEKVRFSNLLCSHMSHVDKSSTLDTVLTPLTVCSTGCFKLPGIGHR